MRVVLAGLVGGAVEVARQRLVQDVVDQAALARARDAGDHGEDAERELDVEVAQVVVPRALDHAAACRCPSRRFVGHRAPRARRAGSAPVSEVGCARDLPPACPRPPPRRRACRRRARGRSPSRRRGWSPRRARPPAPSCRGRACPGGWRSGARCRAGGGRSTARRARRARPSACCRSGWRAGCAGSRRPRASPTSGRASGSRRRRRRGSAAGRRSPAPPWRRSSRSRSASASPATSAAQVGDRQRADSSSIARAADRDRQRLRPQAPALAARAGVDRHVLLDLGAHRRRVGLLVAPLEHRDDALEACRATCSSTSCPRAGRSSSLSPLPWRMTSRARGGSLLPRRREREAHRLGERARPSACRHDFEPAGQGARAPASIERSGSATTLSGSTPISVPRPEQVGQAP